jgi:hypothetical protein
MAVRHHSLAVGILLNHLALDVLQNLRAKHFDGPHARPMFQNQRQEGGQSRPAQAARSHHQRHQPTAQQIVQYHERCVGHKSTHHGREQTPSARPHETALRFHHERSALFRVANRGFPLGDGLTYVIELLDETLQVSGHIRSLNKFGL